MLRTLIAAGSLALAVAACQPTKPTKPPGGDGEVSGSEAEQPPSTPKPRKAPTSEHAGVAHTSNIDKLAMCPDASCVMTRDNVGGLRLWPTLDGSTEPQIVPLRGAATFSAAKSGDAWTAFVVEASGGARAFTVGADGTAEEIWMIPPFEPVLEGHVLPGGKRVLALYKDGSIRILGRKGEVLSKFDERRFQPKTLRLSANGKMLTAALAVTSEVGRFSVEVQRMKIDGDKVSRDGPPRIITAAASIDHTSAVMSTDARRFAIADKGVGDQWEIAVYDLAKDSDPTVHTVKVPAHIVPHLGFVSPTELIVSSNEGALSWLLDLKSGAVRARTPIPQDFSHQGKVQASGPGRQAVAYGTWLFVQDIQERRHRFLGYKAAQGAGVAVSPDNKRVAWAYSGGPIFVEPVKGSGERKRLDPESNFGVTKVRFADRDHLVMVDAAGGIYLYHWPSGQLIDESGVMGSIRTVDLDASTGLLLVDRHNNDASVFEVSPEGIEGPYIVADAAYRIGLLAPKPPSAEVLWTLDGSNKYRTYTLDELKHDLTRSEIDKMGEVLKAGEPAPLAIDRQGRHYGIRWNGAQLELFVGRGTSMQTKSVPSGDINQIVPAPNGERFLVVFNRAGAVSVAVHAAEKLKPLWSYSTGVFNNDVSWSDDAKYVGLAAATGAVLLDAETGVPVQRRCGLEFAVVSSPPQNAFASVGQRSLCEL